MKTHLNFALIGMFSLTPALLSAQTLNIPQDTPAVGPIDTDTFNRVSINNVELTSAGNGLERTTDANALVVNLSGANGAINADGIGIFSNNAFAGLNVTGGSVMGTSGISLSGGLTGDFNSNSEITGTTGTGIFVAGVDGNFTARNSVFGQVNGINVNGTGVGGNFTNNAYVEAATNRGINLTGVGNNFQNNGDIMSASHSIVITGTGVGNNFTNNGMLTSTGGRGISISAPVGGNVNNNGDIQSDSHGIIISDTISGNFQNRANINSDNGRGISLANVDGNVTISNNSVIMSSDRSLVLSGTIGNDLTITGSTLMSTGSGAIVVQDVNRNVNIQNSMIDSDAANGVQANGTVGGTLKITNTDIEGATGGAVFNDVTGKVTLSGGSITGMGANGFEANNLGGGLDIRNIAIEGATGGVALNDVTGNTTISNSMITGNTADGVNANSFTGNVTVNSNSVLSGTTGFFVLNDVDGVMSVNNSDITGTTGNGLDVGGFNGNLSITNGSNVSGATVGVFVDDSVLGKVNINNSMITGTSGHAFQVVNNFEDDVTITNSTLMGGDGAGDYALTATDINGNLKINNGSNLIGADSGIMINNANGTVTISDSVISGGISDAITASELNGATNISSGSMLTGDQNGINVANNLNAPLSITNSTVTGTNNHGIFVGGDINDDVTLNGATVSGMGGWGLATDNLNGDLSLSNSTVDGGADSGVYINTNLTGNVTVTNSTVTGAVHGFEINNDLTGNVTVNNGVTMVTGNGGDGFNIGNNLTGDFTNRGVLMGTNTGVNIGGTHNGNFENFGDITGDMGGYVADTFNGTFTNQAAGNIMSTTAADGVNIFDFTGTFNNHGMISGIDDAVQATNFVGTFNNTGTLTGAFGIFAPNIEGTINNSGLIQTTATSIFLTISMTDFVINNTAGGVIESTGTVAIRLSTGDAEINNTGGQILSNAITIQKTNVGEITVNNTGNGLIHSNLASAVDLTGGDGNDFVTNSRSSITTDAGAQAVSTGAGEDMLMDEGGYLANGGGNPVINMGADNDQTYLFGTNVIRGGTADAYQPALTIAMGNGDDMFMAQSWFNVSGTVNGGNDTDDIALTLSGVNQALLNDIIANNATTGVNADGTLNGTGDLRAFGINIDWTAFETGTYTAFSYASLGQTPNQRNIGSAFDQIRSRGITPDAEMQEILTQIDAQGQGAFPEIANQLSPQRGSEAISDIIFNNASFMDRRIDSHANRALDQANAGQPRFAVNTQEFDLVDSTQDTKLQRVDRKLASLGVASGTASDVPQMAFGGLALRDEEPKYMYDEPKQMQIPMDDPRRFGLWLAGQGIIADVDATDGDLTDFGYNTFDVTFGFDYLITREFVIGGLFNYGNTDVDYDGYGSSLEVDSYTGGLYAAYKSATNGFFANTYVIGGANDYSQDRQISFGTINRTASSDSDGWQLSTGFNTGYLFNLTRDGTWQAGPIGGLQYTYLEQDGYTETGAGALNLNVGSQDADSLRTALGAQIQGRWQLGTDVALVPTVRAEWLHEFLDDSRGINASFNNAAPGSFLVNTSDPDRDFGLIGLNLDFLIGEQWSAFVGYDAQFSGDYFGNSVTGGARYEF